MRGSDGLGDKWIGDARDALIALAMVVGANVEQRVVFAVVPADEG